MPKKEENPDQKRLDAALDVLYEAIAEQLENAITYNGGGKLDIRSYAQLKAAMQYCRELLVDTRPKFVRRLEQAIRFYDGVRDGSRDESSTSIRQEARKVEQLVAPRPR